jgi:hypothetical protein
LISKAEKDFANLVADLKQLSYFQRRVALWDGRKPKLHRFLYKFRAFDAANSESVDRMRDVIVRSRLWLSSAQDFNDPFDGQGKVIAKGSISQKRERLDALLKKQGLTWNRRKKQLTKLAARPDAFYEEKVREFYKGHLNKLGIFCLAGDPRSILMWSHYSDNHRGLWLQFESARDPEVFTQIVTMDYAKEYPILNWTTDFEQGSVALMARKHEGWSYECEARIRVINRAHSYLPFNPEALRAICFGCRTSNPLIERVHTLLDERHKIGLSQLKLFKAVQGDSEYKLVIQKF